MTVQSGIARAIQELLTERQNLAVRIEKLDALVADMRAVFHLPAPERSNGKPREARPVAERSVRRASPVDALIIARLKDGPMAPGALADVLQCDRPALRYRIKQLEAQGAVVSTGTTASRRVALAPGRSAKEAP